MILNLVVDSFSHVMALGLLVESVKAMNFNKTTKLAVSEYRCIYTEGLIHVVGDVSSSLVTEFNSAYMNEGERLA